MIAQESIAQKIVAFLNGEVSEIDLVHWAENAFVELSESDADIPNDTMLLDISAIWVQAIPPVFRSPGLCLPTF